jgi:hypothetical protein
MNEFLAITTSARTRHRKHRREVLADNPKPAAATPQAVPDTGDSE